MSVDAACDGQLANEITSFLDSLASATWSDGGELLYAH